MKLIIDTERKQNINNKTPFWNLEGTQTPREK